MGMGVILTVLYPPGEHSSAQDEPVVVRVDYGQASFLIVGGAGQRAQAAMLAQGDNVRCDVVQVRSRGDEPVVSTAFRDAARPTLIVLSDGDDDRREYGVSDTPGQWFLSGVTIASTSEYGSIEIVSDGTGYDVRGRQ